jgi:hypothetical protein
MMSGMFRVKSRNLKKKQINNNRMKRNKKYKLGLNISLNQYISQNRRRRKAMLS